MKWNPIALAPGKVGARSELGEGEGRVEDAVDPERIEHVGRSRDVGSGGVGGDGIRNGRGIPYPAVAAVSAGRSREPAVLHGHVRQEVGQVPAGAGRGSGQIVPCDGADRVDGGQHGHSVKGEGVRGDRHP